MTEYRFRCTRQLLDPKTGEVTDIKYDVVPVTRKGRIGNWIGHSDWLARDLLADLIKDCAEYDANHPVRQTDIRIQTREVTPWADLDMTEAPDQS